MTAAEIENRRRALEIAAAAYHGAATESIVRAARAFEKFLNDEGKKP